MEKHILRPMGFEHTTSCIRGKRLTARLRKLHGIDRTTPRLILKYSLQKHPREAFVKAFTTKASVKPLWSSGKTLATNAGGRGFDFHWGQNLFFFSHFTLFKVECEELFCKTNIKTIKINNKIDFD